MSLSEKSFILSASIEGDAGSNTIRDLMRQIKKTLKYKHCLEVPKKDIESLEDINYYLFGYGFSGYLKENREKLAQKLKNFEMLKCLVDEGLNHKPLQELFTKLTTTNKWKEYISSRATEDWTIRIKTLNKREIQIEATISPGKEDIKSFPEKLKVLSLTLSRECKGISKNRVLRTLMAQLVKFLGDKHEIKVPKKRFESLNAANYYLFGIGFDSDFEEYRLYLIEKQISKKEIFSLLLDRILDNFGTIRSEWNEWKEFISEDSVLTIKQLNHNGVTLEFASEERKGMSIVNEMEMHVEPVEEQNPKPPKKNQLLKLNLNTEKESCSKEPVQMKKTKEASKPCSDFVDNNLSFVNDFNFTREEIKQHFRNEREEMNLDLNEILESREHINNLVLHGADDDTIVKAFSFKPYLDEKLVRKWIGECKTY